MDFQALSEEAERALRESDPLCSEANLNFSSCRKKAEQAVLLYSKAQFMQDAFQCQLQIMGNAYILLNHTIEGADSTSKDSLRRLQKSDQSLRSLLKELEDTPLDGPNGDANLYSFVNDDDIECLNRQTESLTEDLKQGAGALTKLPIEVQKEISHLRDTAPKLYNENLVKELAHMSENGEKTITDMADLLDSITQHYDLCGEALTLTDQQEIEECKEVLQQDRLQLPDAITTLKAHYSLLESYQKSVDKAVQELETSLEEYAAFHKKTDTFIRTKLRVAVDQLEQRNQHLKQRFSKVDELTEEINELCKYYKLFQQGYVALSKEKQRRQRYEEQMAHLVSEINSSISRQHQKEVNARREFIQTHGEYLPNNIWDNLYELPKLHILISKRDDREGYDRGERSLERSQVK